MNFVTPFLMQTGLQFSPIALGIAAVVAVILILVLRFIVKTAITLVKIAIVVLVGGIAYLGFQTFL